MSLSLNFPVIQPSLTLDFANAGRLDPRISFTRASPAVYYDGNTSTKAEENLLLWSQEFQQSAWAAVSLDNTVTANTTVAPDGTTTADTISFLSTGYRYQNYTSGLVTGRTFTFSCWVWTTTAKVNIAVRLCGNTTGSDQTIVVQALTGTATRVTVTRTFTSTDTQIIFGFDNRVSIGANGIAGDIVVWGAQLEERSTATAYNLTTTLGITNYIPVLLTAPNNVARFDHNPVTSESLGLLIEGTRDNLVSYSAAFDNAYWTKLGSTITPSTNVAPDGTLTAATMTFVSGTPQFYRSLTKAASAITYTISCYAKAYTASVFQLQLSDNTTGQCTANFNLATGVVTGTTAGTWASPSGAITPVGNGWYRCSLTGTSPANTGLLPTFVCPNAGAIFVWGAQLEAGAFVTSYIPTVAISQSRQADLPQMTGTNFSSWFNVNEGTFYAESAPIGVYNSNTILAVSGGSVYTTGNGMLLRRNIGNFEAGGNNTSTAVSLAQVTGTFYKTAFGYTVTSTTTNTLSVVANGSTPATLSTLDFTGTGTTHFIIGALTTGQVQQGNLLIRKIAFYPRRLTNNQLQNLTESP